MRLWSRRRAERIARQEAAWRGAMHEAMERPVEERLAPIAEGDLPDFLMLWNRLQETQRGPAAENLGRLLRDNGLDKRALALLRAGSVRSRLIAMSTLGFAGAEEAWPALEAIAGTSGTMLSFAAARAMLRIEPRRALDALTPSIMQRNDWSVARLGCMFTELGPAVVTPSLTTMLVSRPRSG